MVLSKAMRGSPSRRAVVALIAALCCGLAACRTRPAAPPNVLVVLVDTLRADRLGAYGSTRGLTPFLDELAAHSTVFGTTYAQSSWTNPSVASLFTSRYQSQHHVTSFESVLAADEVTLAEQLKQHGYATGAFIANFLLAGRLGFNQGFDHYRTYWRPGEGSDPFLKARAERINREALQWLDEVRAGPPPPPVFLYVHYMEPHSPYDPPDAVLDRVRAGRPRPDVDEANRLMRLASWVVDFDEPAVRNVEVLYDAEVASLDASLQALFEALQQRGFLDNALVIVTADHGEELNEHHLMGHHKSLFEPAIRIPLLMQRSRQTVGTAVDGYAQLIDIAPTVLDMAGIAAPPTFVGRSLRPYLVDPAQGWLAALRARLAPPAPLARQAFSELIKEADAPRKLPHERAAMVDATKLLVSASGERSYYDLVADAGEAHPDALDPARRARLDGALDTLRASASPAGAGRKAGMDDLTRERMRVLGYAE